jgi:hypothetical protein
MDRETAIKSYGKGAAAVYDETISQFQNGNTFDDKPANWRWVSRDRNRVRVIKMYHLDDDGWHFCEFTRCGILKAGPSPWLDEDGEPTHGYVWRSAYCDRDNNRYGAARDLIPVQDAINKRLSKFLHLISVRQTYGSDSVVPDVNKLRSQLARPDGHVSMPDGMEFGKHFGVLPTGDMADGQFKLLEANLNMLQTLGPNADMTGDGKSSQSGRAILANQQGGMIQLGTLFDSLRSFDRSCFRRMWLLVRQFWTGERWVRVTDDERNLQWVGLNQPTLDPMTGQVVVKNAVADLDVDIIIDDAPKSPGIQAEQFEQLTQLASTGVVFPPKVYIKASNLRNKAELLKELEEAQAQAQQAQGASPEQIALEAKQAETQMALQAKQAETQIAMEMKELEAQMKQAETQMKLQAMQTEMEFKQRDREAELQAEQMRSAMELQHKQQLADMDHADRQRSQSAEFEADAYRRQIERDDLVASGSMERGADGKLAPQGTRTMLELAETVNAMAQQVNDIVVMQNAPKRIVRDPQTGRVSGVETVGLTQNISRRVVRDPATNEIVGVETVQ